MSLTHNKPVGFVPTRDAKAARAFYEGTLGLRFVTDDQFAMIFLVGSGDGTMLRVVRVPQFEPFPFTIFGWETPEMDDAVRELTAKGVAFERFGFLDQDERGVWNAPGGAQVAWFKDPDGNMLSLTKHP